MKTPVIMAILFGLGVGFCFFGLSLQKQSDRFRRDLYQEKSRRLLGIFRPMLYTRLGRFIMGKPKSLSQAELESLLARAGRPWGLKPSSVQFARIALPVVSLLMFIFLYGAGLLWQAVQILFTAPGLHLNEVRSGGLPVLFCLALVVFAYFLPVYMLQYLAWVRDNRIKEEQGTFMETIFTLLRIKQPLRVALEEAAKTAVFLKPYLRVCLNEWPTDRIRALRNLKRNVGVPRFEMIIDMLIQAATVGDDQIADFLEENKKLEDELINISASANQIRPVDDIQMLIPVSLFSWYFYPAIVR